MIAPVVKKPAGPFFSTLIGVLLFTSGLLVPVTPLAYVYVALTAGFKRFWQAAGLSLAAVALLYVFGADWLYAYLQAGHGSAWFVSLPGLNLAAHFPIHFVVLFGIGQFAFYLAIARIVAGLLLRPKNLYARALRSGLAVYLVLTVLLVLVLLPQAQTYLQSYQVAISQGIGAMMDAMDKSADMATAQAVYLKTALEFWRQYSLYILPLLFLFSVSFVFVLNLTLAKRVFFPFRPELLLIKFTQFRLPFSCVWLVVVSLAVLLLNIKFFKLILPGFVAFNLLGGLLMLYFYQGLSILVFLIDRIQLRGLWRIFLYFIFIYLFFATSALTTLFGFFDSWLDVRKKLSLKTR